VAASGIGTGDAVAHDSSLLEIFIARHARPAPKAIASFNIKLKILFAA